jgi:uncharacterized Zn finger protein
MSGTLLDQKIFLVQGSSPEPYKVVFTRRSNINLSAYCSCPAGENGLYCKHRLEILAGNTRAVLNPNSDDITTVRSWLIGSDVEKALLKVNELEEEAARIKKALTLAKADLDKAMRD